ncbi:AAA family ATPase [Methanolobus psychrotolerans]|uniref:AAA family ATPase n=1 Tax=Methanolobus psychrotolerans TaxID=1874706 RepID=UPI000B91678D|nr:AAA family ATPase [Methanolobus psychrotolerans]
MWISKISIKNFRPFYGEQEIIFDEGSKDKFTIIEAKADTGKTSLLSAISWCLYEKDIGDLDKERAHNVFNLQRKDELEEGAIDDLKVEITLNEDYSNLPKYIIERECVFQKSGARMVPIRIPSVKVSEWNDSNDSVIYDTPATQAFCRNIINSILPEDIHMFFLFEGEKLEKHFSFNNSENIKSSIEKISQIEYVKSAHLHLKKAREKVHSVKNESKGDKELERNLSLIDERRSRIEDIEIKIKNANLDIQRAESRINEIDLELDKVNVPLLKEWASKRANLEKSNNELNNTYKNLQKEITSSLVKTVPHAICRDALESMLKSIEVSERKDELPPKIKNVYIRELLDKKTCICGRNLDPDFDEESHKACEILLETLKQNDLSDLSQTLIEGRFHIIDLLKKVPQTLLDQRMASLSNLKDIETTISANNAEIAEINEKAKDINEKGIKSLNEERMRLRDGLKVQEQAVGRLEGAIRKVEAEISTLSRENDNIAKKMNGYEQTKITAEFMDRAIKHLHSIHKDILAEVRNTVEQKTFESFKNLHWDQTNYTVFSIGADYKMKLKDENENEKILDISSGTKQVLLLSYIAALSEVSGFKFPIFIDTPLANTDNEQRMNIAEKFPNYLRDNQVILLVKDQEYTPSFREKIYSRVNQEMRMIKEGASTKVRPWE